MEANPFIRHPALCSPIHGIAYDARWNDVPERRRLVLRGAKLTVVTPTRATASHSWCWQDGSLRGVGRGMIGMRMVSCNTGNPSPSPYVVITCRPAALLFLNL